MPTRRHNFLQGLLAGALAALVAVFLVLYTLVMTGSAVIELPQDSLTKFVNYIYDNLKLSIIPFTLVLMTYGYYLHKLRRHLHRADADLDEIAQTEHLIDTCIHLFFGIGVIWTAIGMRGALMYALGDPESAAAEGAFALLQRMVDGGILLSLSTTIFGGIGGYVMRLAKSLVVGQKLQQFYNQALQQPGQEAHQTLLRIEQHLCKLLQQQEVQS